MRGQAGPEPVVLGSRARVLVGRLCDKITKWGQMSEGWETPNDQRNGYISDNGSVFPFLSSPTTEVHPMPVKHIDMGAQEVCPTGHISRRLSHRLTEQRHP
jgi:hypothetical protein